MWSTQNISRSEADLATKTGWAVLKTKELTSSFKMFTVSSSSFQLTWRMKMGLVYLMFCGEFLICNRTAGKKLQSQKYLKQIDYNKLSRE